MTSRAIGLTLAPESLNDLPAELRLAKEALLGWKDRWGSNCDLVMWTIVMDPADHQGVEEVLTRVYEEEADLSPLLRSVRMQVNLLGKNGKPVKQYERQAEAKQPKPWWKVW